MFRKTWVRVVATLALFAVLVLVALPYAASYAMHKWLLENGGESVRLDDVDFNPFTGKAAVTQLHVIAQAQPHLTIPRLELDVEWLPMYSKQVYLKAVRVDGVEITVELASDGTLTVGGIALGDAAGDPDSGPVWDFGVEQLQISNSVIEYRSPDLKLETTLDKVQLSGLTTWATDPAPLAVQGTVNGAAVRLSGQLPPLSAGFGYSGQLNIDALPLATFAGIAAPALAELDGALTVDNKLDLLQAPDGALQFSQNGLLQTDGLRLRLEGDQVAFSQLQWQGKADLALPAAGTLQSEFRGRLTGTGIELDIPAQGLALQQGEIKWDGEAVVTGGEVPVVETTGSLSMKQVSADVPDSKLRLASLDAMKAGNVTVNAAGDFVIDDLALNGVAFARENAAAGSDGATSADSLLTAAAVTVDHLQLSAGNRLAIGNMEWRDTTSSMRREADGQWQSIRIINTLPFAGTQDGEEAATAGEEDVAASVRVDTLRVTGQSAIIMRDASVEPVFNMRLDLTEAVLRNIDSANPEQDSPITVEGRFDKHSRFALNGTTRPLAERPTVQLNTFIEGLALTPLSSYTGQSMGYILKSGHLDSESDVRINKGKMEVRNDLTIRGLEIEHVHNESRAELDKQLALPLDVALNMLRDKHNTIRLKLPVNGDIDSPDFDISDAINQAIGSAMKQGSLTYLTMALQPYGALITVARLAGDAASRVRLDPVVFEPGAVANREASSDYLNKVAGILEHRPNINIKVCGIAIEADREVLSGTAAGDPPAQGKAAAGKDAVREITDERILELATQRAAAVKDYLVTEHAVSASRLVACQARIDDADDAGEPRVELLI